MKTNKIKFFFCIITFCFLVTSCKNLLSELTQQKTYIQISTNLDTPNQRTVLPDFSVVQEKGYTWELYSDGKVLQTWNDDEQKSAYQNMCGAQIEVDTGSYSFELNVKKEDKIILKSESQTVTIEQNKNNVLNFVLYPPTENEADGSVNFILKFPNEKVNIVEANLFKPDDDKKETVGSMPEVEISPTESLSTANITVNNVPAGSYLLQVDLCYQVGDYSRKETINTYSTIVQVAPGFCSKAEVTLESLTDYYTITYKVNDETITTFQGSNEIPTTFKKNSNVRLQIACNSTNQISIGWFKDKDCTEPVELNSDDTFTITENTTLYTQWGNEVNTDYLRFDTIDTINNIKGLLINDKAGLNYFRDIVNGTLTENIIVSDTVVYRSGTTYPTVNAKLCSDIALTEDQWVPIGNSTNYYQGTFDGNGKCVTNLNITTDSDTDLGFFGCVQDATIKNLYVQGKISATNDSYSYAVGGIVGSATSSEGGSVTISNCINNVQIDSKSILVGGILGYLQNIMEITIESCVNIAELKAQYPSGILNTYGNSTINNCLNLGNLTSNSTSLNLSAGICLTHNENCSVSKCINTGIMNNSIDDTVSPILMWKNTVSGSSPNCTDCFYDSDKIENHSETSFGSGIPSSELDTVSLQGWDNTESDSKYPIPSKIKETFNSSSCWDNISNAISIQKNENPEPSTGYVEGAYFVNGETGNDNNDGLSINTPYKKLTTAITKAIDSDAKKVYVSGTLVPSNQDVTNPSSTGDEQYSVFYIQNNTFTDVVEIIGVTENTNFSGNNETRIFSTKNACNFTMKNINFINGKTQGSGAAIYFYQGKLELDNCKISDNSSSSDDAYNGIYTYGDGSILKMTNTTCENSVYLSATTATIGNDCVIGTSNTTATDGFITLDNKSTLILDGKNIVIYKPIYVKNSSSSIQIGNTYSSGEKITIKLASGITKNYDNSNQYTLITNCNETKSNYFTIVCEDSTKSATLGADGKITVN